MELQNKLNETWVKASIIGTVWAASEIIIGSFLHNLKIPFSGNILTSFAIILLISFSYVWKDKGLFWRAGVICALMKTISPSAVIFGPMIAIIAQAFILETSVRTLGRNAFAFIIGSMIAMSWNLFQKIITYIILYGFNIVEVYQKLISFAQKQLNIDSEIIWTPIIILLVLYSLMGLLAALVGIYSGRKINQYNYTYNNLKNAKLSDFKLNKTSNDFSFSLYWLMFNVFVIIGALFLLNFTTWYFWGPAILAITVVWIFRYKRALKKLQRPRFWILFFIITMIAALAFSGFKVENIYSGLYIGIRMNFRAVLLLIGFSVLGTELYNPKIRKFFAESYFRNLPLALELSFESLPNVIANRPDYKKYWRNPYVVIHQIIAMAENRLSELKSVNKGQVFFVSGPIDSGKTSQIKSIISNLAEKNIKTGGFISQKIIENNYVIGYDIKNVLSKEEEVFLRLDGDNDFERIGRYFIFPKGIEAGIKAIDDALENDCRVVVIDEVGLLELNNKGWVAKLEELLKRHNISLIISVRDCFLEEIKEKFRIQNTLDFDSMNDNIKTIVIEIEGNQTKPNKIRTLRVINP